jgi:ubiquitin carboxyl-terminal hydrolase L5
MDDARDEQPAAAAEEERRRSSRIRAVSSTPSEAADQNIPQKRGTSVDVDSPQQPKRTLRRRNSDKQNGTGADPIDEAMKPLTDEERRNWKGWVELESDPVSYCALLFIPSHRSTPCYGD